MKTINILILFIFLSIHISFSQVHHLEGTVSIQLNEGIIESEMTISNFHIKTDKPTILLNYKYEVYEILFNGRNIAIPSKTGGNGYFEYIIPVGKIPSKEDRLTIRYKGDFDVYNESNQKEVDNKGYIAFNYGILRASEQSKWYPILLETNDFNPVRAFSKSTYSYQIEVNCPDCQSTYVGQGSPQYNKGENMIFSSDFPLNEIMLIAGNFDWGEEKNFYYINFNGKNKKNLIRNYQKIISYYEELSDIKINTKFTIASCPSDVSWAFVTYPTIVFTNKKGYAFQSTLSHEIAHYYFGHEYEFGKELYYFYSESFAEYYSMKYFISQNYSNAQAIKYLRMLNVANYIPGAKQKHGFVRLKNVKHYDKVHSSFRYLIGPFILFGIDQEIGEDNMKAFIKQLFSVKTSEHSDYDHFIRSLREIGIEERVIKRIKNKYIKRFRQRKFIKALKNVTKRDQAN